MNDFEGHHMGTVKQSGFDPTTVHHETPWDTMRHRETPWDSEYIDMNQWRKTSSCAINVDSKAALLAIANKHSTHPLAVDTRRKTIELRTATSITFRRIKWHADLKGNDRTDYLAKTVASYNPIITYDAIPVPGGKRLLEDYYTKIWNATYINSEKASTPNHSFPPSPQNVHPRPAKPHPHTTHNKPRLPSLISP